MKYTLTFFILLFISVPFFAWTKNPPIDQTEIETKVSVQKDTVYIVKQTPDEETIKSYQEILEKTNSQLSLWWNPFGVLVGLLGVLFTVLTIIAAVVIYRQSREHKELIKESITKYENVLGQMITERNQQLKNIEKNLNSTINEYKERLKTATEENKQEIKKLIQTLETQKESIDTQLHTNHVIPEHLDQFLTAGSPYGIKQTLHKCSQCGYGYIVQPGAIYAPSYNTLGHGYRSKSITCPKCGNVESY